MQASQSSSVPSSKALQLLKQDYICPITCDIMEIPMILPCCGQTFQREVIQRILAQTSVCPMCRCQVHFSQAIINRNLRNTINKFKDILAKKQEKKRREAQEQLKAIAGMEYSKAIRKGLKYGRKMTPEEQVMFEILPTGEKLIRLAIQQILESLRLQQRAKIQANVSATQALNYGQGQFAKIITDS